MHRDYARKATAFVVACLLVTTPALSGVEFGMDNQPIVGSAEAAAGDTEWQNDTGGGSTPVTIVDGVAYYGNNSGGLVAVDADTGDKIWGTTFTGEVTAAPNVVNGTVYVNGYDSENMYAFDAETGNKEWEFSMSGYSDSAPTVKNGTVYVGGSGQSARFYAVDAETGNEIWAQSGNSSYDYQDFDAAPVIKDGVVYAGSNDQSIYAFDAESGDELWSYWTGGDVRSVSYGDGLVYTSSYASFEDGTFYAFDADTGDIEWQRNLGNENESVIPTVSNGLVYMGVDNLRALDAQTGEEEWNFQLSGELVTGPTVANGIVYAGGYQNTMYAVDAATGTEQWTYSYTNRPTHLTISEGTAYISGGNTTAVDVGHEESSSGTRVTLGILGHTDAWAGTLSPIISGTVTDQSGNPIEDAYVEVRNSSGTVWNGLADSNGQYESADLADGEYTVTAGAESYADQSKTVSVSGSPETADFSLKQTVSGRVVTCGDGTTEFLPGYGGSSGCTPVDNATVRLMAVNYEELDVDPSEYEVRGEELLEQATNVTPPNWTRPENLDLNAEFQDTSGKYVAMHTQSDWDLRGFDLDTLDRTVGADPQLSQPTVQLDSDETAVFSVWDASGSGLIQDNVDEDLPGATASGTVVIESVGAGGEQIDTQRVNTSGTVRIRSVSNPGAKTHETATADLPEGFFRIYPEENPAASQVIVVGDPGSIVSGWEEDIRDEAGDLTDRAQSLRDWRNESKIEFQTTTTDSNGNYELAVDSTRLDTASVIAYRTPSGMNVDDPRNITMEDLRVFYASSDYNGSFVLPTTPEQTDVPASGVDVQVREVDAPTYADLDRFENVSDWLSSYLANESFTDLPAPLQQALNDTSRENLEDTYNELENLTQDNSELRDRYEELLDEGTSEDINLDVDAPDLADSELRERVETLQQTISELRDTIEAGEGVTDITNETITSEQTFDTALDKDDVTVMAHWTNGTSIPVPDQFISVDQSAGTTVGAGETTVSVEDFPIEADDPAGLEFEYIVANEDGVGREDQRIENPSFDGETPSLDAVDLSTLAPGPDETVRVRAVPSDDSGFRQLAGATVYAPDGSEIDVSNVSDGTRFNFSTVGDGRYTVRVQMESTGGATFTETFRLRATEEDINRPASIRAVSGPTGLYALTGEDFSAGRVDVSDNGQSLDVVAQLPESADAPSGVSLYTESVSVPPSATTNLHLVRGESEESLGETVGVTVHTKRLSDSVLLYRNGNPVTRDGSTRHGTFDVRQNGATIETYTDEQGTLELETLNTPGWIERIQHRLSTLTADLPGLPFALDTSVGVSIGTAGVLGIITFRHRSV